MNNMSKTRKLLVVMLALLLLTAACQAPPKTAAEEYLASHTEDEITEYFCKADYIPTDFNAVADISSYELYEFAGCFGQFATEENYDENDQQYHVPVADVYAVLDQYFADYSLAPEDCWFAEYDPAKQEFTTPILVFSSQLSDYELVAAEAIDADNVKVQLLGSFDYDSENSVNFDVYVTAKIVDGQAKFTSCQNSELRPVSNDGQTESTGYQEQPKTAAEEYLASHTEDEITEYFSEVKRFYYDFDDPKEIPPDVLDRFALRHDKDSWYNAAEQTYYIPLADIYAILDDYLTEYELPASWYEEFYREYNEENEPVFFHDYYDADNQMIVIESAIGMGVGSEEFSLIDAAAVDADTVKVTLLEYCSDPDSTAPDENVYITAKIVDGRAKFTSCKTVMNAE